MLQEMARLITLWYVDPAGSDELPVSVLLLIYEIVSTHCTLVRAHTLTYVQHAAAGNRAACFVAGLLC